MFSQIATQFSDIRRILKIGAFCTALSGGHYCSSSSSSSYFELANFRSIAETETESEGRGKKEEMTQNRRQKKQISISDTFISGLLPYSPWNSLRCVFIYPATGEGRGEKKALNLSLFKKEPHAVFFGCVQQQNSGTSWLTRITNSPNFCQRINL